MKLTRHEQIIWAAGFFDGEGCVQIARVNQKNPGSGSRSVNFKLVISTSNVDRRPLEIFTALFGGCVVLNNREGRWRACYQWQATTEVAALALVEMMPWLVVKREQAELAIEFQDLRKKGNTTMEERTRRYNRDQGMYEQMRELKITVT